MNLKSIDGLPLMNATEALHLRVTARDIATANAKEPDHCAVARACRRTFHVKEARVHLSHIYLRTNDGNWLRYATPAAMRDEIIAFDRGGTFAPQEFVLAPLKPSAHATGRAQGSKNTAAEKKKRGRKAVARRKPHVVTDVRSGPA